MSVKNLSAKASNDEIIIDYFKALKELICQNKQLESSKIDKMLFSHSLIKVFSSNHPKRYKDILRKAQSIEGIYSLKTYAENQPFILYAGDSHAEFASRLPQGFSSSIKQEVSQSCYWLGPRTLYGFLSKKTVREKIFKYLAYISQEQRKFALVLSFGEIDIRNLIYRMILSRRFSCVDEFTKSLYPLMQNFVQELEASSQFRFQLYFIAPPRPCQQSKYSTPKSIEDLDIFDKKNYLVPTLAPPSTRLEFYDSINTFFINCAQQGILKYIDRGQIGSKNGYFDPRCSHDGIHMSSQTVLEQQLDLFNALSRKLLQMETVKINTSKYP